MTQSFDLLRGGVARAALAACLLALGLFAFASQARAATYEQVPTHFGVSGEAANQLINAKAVAINHTGVGGVQPGSFYVIGNNNRVARFAPGSEGEEPQFEEAWGWGIAEGGGASEYARCGPAVAAHPQCKPTSGNAPVGGEQPGHFNNLSGVAVDQTTGDVYVRNGTNENGTGARQHHLIEVFTAKGALVGEGFGDSGLGTSSPPESIAEGPAKLHRTTTGTSAIAVDASGKVYLLDSDYIGVEHEQARVMSFEPCAENDYETYCYAEGKDISVQEEPLHMSLVGSDHVVVASESLIREYPLGQPDPEPTCHLSVAGQLFAMTTNEASGEVFYFVHSKKKIYRRSACDEATGQFPEIQNIAPEPIATATYALAVNPTLSWGPLRPAGILYSIDAEIGQPAHGDVFAPAKGPGKSLTVSKDGSGAGTVTSSPAAIDCGSTCSVEFLEGSTVTLTATPAEGSTFNSWSGECASTSGNKCEVTMSAVRSVTATFEPEGGGTPEYALITHVEGEGTIECAPPGGGCAPEREYLQGTAVTLTAVAESGWQFTEWTGACAGTLLSVCEVTISEATEAGAVFDLVVHKLTVSVSGEGEVNANEPPNPTSGQISGCEEGGGECAAEYLENAEVTLVATPEGGNQFEGWTGCDTEPGGNCRVKMTEAKTVEAEFAPIPPTPEYELEVSVSGEGEVSADSGTISGCTSAGGPSCEGSYAEGATVTLTETPAPGSHFTGWQTPQCDESTEPTCEIAIGSADEAVAASFAPNSVSGPPLTLKIEEGEGTVVSDPAGLECTGEAPHSCTTEEIEAGTVTLTASPAPGYVFKSWKGCDKKSGIYGVEGRQCTIDLSEVKEVGAKFTKTYELTLHNEGGGKVSSKPGGALCLPGCTEASASFKEGTSVEVLPKPNKHFHLASWGGDCSGSGSCIVPMNEDREVIASFAEDAKHALSLSKGGGGSALIKTKGPGSVCSYTCSSSTASFYEGEEVLVSWKLAKGTSSLTWTSGAGSCTGTHTGAEGSCEVTISGAESLVAELE